MLVIMVAIGSMLVLMFFMLVVMVVLAVRTMLVVVMAVIMSMVMIMIVVATGTVLVESFTRTLGKFESILHHGIHGLMGEFLEFFI